jgi:hypothetical protein
MTVCRLIALVAAALFGLADAGAAQNRTNEFQQGTALSAFGGAGTSSATTGGVFGAAMAWEFTPFFTLEGSGTWIDGGTVDGSAGLISSRVHLTPRRRVVPFLSAGMGVYRSMVDSGGGPVPEFYQRRIDEDPVGSLVTEHSFNDFALALGGGVDLYVQRHLSVRPDVRVLLVRGNGDTWPVSVYGINFSYHFEDRLVTPTK